MRFAGTAFPGCAATWFDAVRGARTDSAEGDRDTDVEGAREDQDAELRGLLLPLQPALRAVGRRALCDVPPRPPRGPASSAPAAVPLPAAGPHHHRLGVPQRPGAGGTAQVVARTARPGDGEPSPVRVARMKIRAAVLEEFAQPLVVQEVDLDGPGPGEVLVRLSACGVCHTDMYTASGADPSGY